METLGGRKFVATIIIAVLGTSIELIGKNGLSQSLMMFLGGTLTAYIGGNSIAARIFQGSANPAVSVDTSAVEQKIDGLVESINSASTNGDEGAAVLLEMKATIDQLALSTNNMQKVLLAALGKAAQS